MARPTTAARRYAEAAFELADRDGTHDDWARDLEWLGEVGSNDRARQALDNPAAPRVKRQELLTELAGKRVSTPALNLGRLMVDRGRVELLPAVSREFRRLLNRREGIAEAEITSARPLTRDETEAVRERVEAMAGSKVDLRVQVDESLIGGLTVKVAGRLHDASVRGRLERLRAELVAGTRAR